MSTMTSTPFTETEVRDALATPEVVAATDALWAQIAEAEGRGTIDLKPTVNTLVDQLVHYGYEWEESYAEYVYDRLLDGLDADMLADVYLSPACYETHGGAQLRECLLWDVLAVGVAEYREWLDEGREDAAQRKAEARAEAIALGEDRWEPRW